MARIDNDPFIMFGCNRTRLMHMPSLPIEVDHSVSDSDSATDVMLFMACFIISLRELHNLPLFKPSGNYTPEIAD
eukprot:4561004-Amphidinium_carterae.2